MNQNQAIQATGLSKVYRSSHREVAALDDVSFELNQGEILGFIGRNGSGKSTLLKVLGQMIKPDSGEAFVRGKLAAVYDIGSGFHPDLSGRENIFVRGELLGLKSSSIQEKLDEIISFSGLGDAIEEQLNGYSQGMFLRLAFSTLICLEADTILLDEVLHVGDQMFRRKIQSFFQELKRKRNQSFVLVSHELGFIAEVADRLIWLENGRVMAEGKPAKVIEKYLQFLGSGTDWKKVKQEQNAYFHSPEISVQELKVEGNGPGEFTSINWEEPIHINIEYEVAKPGQSYEFIIGVKDIFDNPIVLFSEAMDEGYAPIPSEVGKYRMEFIIPPRILDRGNYRIDIRIARDAEDLIVELPDILSLVIEKPYSGFTKFPIQKKPLIAPDIKWSKRRI